MCAAHKLFVKTSLVKRENLIHSFLCGAYTKNAFMRCHNFYIFFARAFLIFLRKKKCPLWCVKHARLYWLVTNVIYLECYDVCLCVCLFARRIWDYQSYRFSGLICPAGVESSFMRRQRTVSAT